MNRVKKILIPTDFSAATDDVLHFVSKLTGDSLPEITLLHVTETADPYAATPLFYSDKEMFETHATNLKDEIMALLQKYKGVLEKDGVKNIKLEYLTGNPFIEIVKYAEKSGVDLIVMGSHGRSGLEYVFLGSVAEQVIRNANCPVLTIKKRGFKFKPLWQK